MTLSMSNQIVESHGLFLRHLKSCDVKKKTADRDITQLAIGKFKLFCLSLYMGDRNSCTHYDLNFVCYYCLHEI